MKPNWKVATVSGVVAAAGLGGFALAGADTDDSDVRTVELQRAEVNASAVDSPLTSPSSTTVIPSAPTTVAPVAPPATAPQPVIVPPPSIAFDDSADSPDTAPAPAPAPFADDSPNDSADDSPNDSADDSPNDSADDSD